MKISVYKPHKRDGFIQRDRNFSGGRCGNSRIWSLDGKLLPGKQRNLGFGNKQAGQEAGRKPWAGEGKREKSSHRGGRRK